MSTEVKLPLTTKDANGNWDIPKQLAEILSQTDNVAVRIRRSVAQSFRNQNQPEKDQHKLAAKYFLDLLIKSVAWGVNEGKWDYSLASIPSDQGVGDIILRHLIDKNQPPIVIGQESLGHGIDSFKYIPTNIPTLWIREIVVDWQGEIRTTRTIYSQTALLDLQ